MRNHEMTFRGLRWSRATADGQTMTGYLYVDGRGSLRELLDHLEHVAPGVDLDEVTVGGCTVMWQRPATPAERDEWATWQRQREARTLAWERATYERLRAKFE
jgi:hypothetical protein